MCLRSNTPMAKGLANFLLFLRARLFEGLDWKFPLDFERVDQAFGVDRVGLPSVRYKGRPLTSQVFIEASVELRWDPKAIVKAGGTGEMFIFTRDFSHASLDQRLTAAEATNGCHIGPPLLLTSTAT